MIVSESVTINRAVEPVYEAFADLKRWIEILPDVLDVEILYFDGYNEEFTMTVERPKGAETIRGIRYYRPYVELEIFQPQPPPGLKKMSGTWRFKEESGQTTVVATRYFRLLDDASSANGEEAFGQKLRKILNKNLLLFKEAVEHHGSN